MFFPLMRAANLNGFLDLLNDSPNNWEKFYKRTAKIYALRVRNNKWETENLFDLSKGEFKTLTSKDFHMQERGDSLILFYPSKKLLPKYLDKLPEDKFWFSEIPAWRNTSGFANELAQVSYQSDVEPLPRNASLLTFHPFIQYKNIENYLIVLNVIKDPIIEAGPIYLFDSKTLELRGIEQIKTNSVSTIALDKYGFQPTDLPIFYSPKIAGIPFGLGIKKDNSMLSLEHTHPPASFVLFGDRRKVQGAIKKSWIEKLSKNVPN